MSGGLGEKGPSPTPKRTEDRSYVSRLVSLASTSLIKKKVRSSTEKGSEG